MAWQERGRRGRRCSPKDPRQARDPTGAADPNHQAKEGRCFHRVAPKRIGSAQTAGRLGKANPSQRSLWAVPLGSQPSSRPLSSSLLPPFSSHSTASANTYNLQLALNSPSPRPSPSVPRSSHLSANPWPPRSSSSDTLAVLRCPRCSAVSPSWPSVLPPSRPPLRTPLRSCSATSPQSLPSPPTSPAASLRPWASFAAVVAPSSGTMLP